VSRHQPRVSYGARPSAVATNAPLRRLPGLRWSQSAHDDRAETATAVVAFGIHLATWLNTQWVRKGLGCSRKGVGADNQGLPGWRALITVAVEVRTGCANGVPYPYRGSAVIGRIGRQGLQT
jgi:hypothetical protein